MPEFHVSNFLFFFLLEFLNDYFQLFEHIRYQAVFIVVEGKLIVWGGFMCPLQNEYQHYLAQCKDRNF